MSRDLRNKPLAPHQWLDGFVRANADDILAMYADEMISFEEIAKRLQRDSPDYTISPSRLRVVMLSDVSMHARLVEAQGNRAHAMIDDAVRDARAASTAGDFAQAATLKLKIAAKLAPEIYGDSIAVTGAGGQPLNGTVGVSDHELESIIAASVAARNGEARH
jgi:hypothetical protein